MADDALANAKKAIPAEVHMINGCRDEQTSADVSNVASFSLPDPKGRAGGALTSALLNVTYKDNENTGKDLSFMETLLQVRGMLKQKGFSQIPQLSSSRPMDINNTFDLVPPGMTGARRAVMIYIDTSGELRACHDDVNNMKKYIMNVHGFQEENIAVLMDDDEHTLPTRDNILNAFLKVVADARPGDAVFCHFSGHGGKVRDYDADESDGYDETLIPVDYMTCAGEIRDVDLYNTLVGGLKEGVYATLILDCCHSGNVLDLPYTFVADGEGTKMRLNQDYDFSLLLKMAKAFKAGQRHDSHPFEAIMTACSGCTIS